MTRMFSRRGAVQLGLVGGGMLALPAAVLAQPRMRVPPGPNPMYPEHYLKVILFSTGGDLDWYEKVHAPDFIGFTGPHMARYSRNWLTGVESGETPAFKELTEIHYKDAAARQSVRDLMNSPVSDPFWEHTMSHGAERRKANNAPPPSPSARVPLFSATPHAVTAPTAASVAPAAPRRLILLRRQQNAAQAAFEASATAMAREIARSAKGSGVSLDLLASDPDAPADALIWIDNGGKAKIPSAANKPFRVVSVLKVDTRNSVR